MREGGKKGTRDKEWTAAYIKGKAEWKTVFIVCFLLTKVKEILESESRLVVSDSLRQSMEFSRPEYWSG